MKLSYWIVQPIQREKPITSDTQTSLNPYHYYSAPRDEPFAIRYDTPFLFMVYERTHRLPIIVGCYAGEPSIERALVDEKLFHKRSSKPLKWKCSCCQCCRKPKTEEWSVTLFPRYASFICCKIQYFTKISKIIWDSKHAEQSCSKSSCPVSFATSRYSPSSHFRMNFRLGYH